MFDARPLAMTAAGKIQNYLGQDPAPWTGKNGLITGATSLVKPLSPFKDRFSVMNGVVMTPSFDGHAQNMNFLFTGDPFGGDSFIPHLNVERGRTSRRFGGCDRSRRRPEFTALNHSGVIPLVPRALARLAGASAAASARPCGGPADVVRPVQAGCRGAWRRQLFQRRQPDAVGSGQFPGGAPQAGRAFRQ